MFAEGEQEKKLLKSKCKCMCLCVYKTAKLCHKKFDREKKKFRPHKDERCVCV